MLNRLDVAQLRWPYGNSSLRFPILRHYTLYHIQAYGTWYSLAITHLRSVKAQCYLTSLIAQEPVFEIDMTVRAIGGHQAMILTVFFLVRRRSWMHDINPAIAFNIISCRAESISLTCQMQSGIGSFFFVTQKKNRTEVIMANSLIFVQFVQHQFAEVFWFSNSVQISNNCWMVKV